MCASTNASSSSTCPRATPAPPRTCRSRTGACRSARWIVPGCLVRSFTSRRARAYKGQAVSPSGFTEALASAVQMGLAVESFLCVRLRGRRHSARPERSARDARVGRRRGGSRAVRVRARRGSADQSALRSRAGVVSDRRAVAHNEAPARPLRRGRGKFAGGEAPYAVVFSAATGASSFQKSSSSGFRPIEDALKCGSRPALRWAT